MMKMNQALIVSALAFGAGCDQQAGCEQVEQSVEAAQMMLNRCGLGGCGIAPRIGDTYDRIDMSSSDVGECAERAEFNAIIRTDEYAAYVFRCEINGAIGEFAVKYFQDHEFYSRCTQVHYAFVKGAANRPIGSISGIEAAAE